MKTPQSPAPVAGDKSVRQETTSEHIARDMREGRFPARSEPQMVPSDQPVEAIGAGREAFEEAIRLAEVGEFLIDAKGFAAGNGYDESRELSISWDWQQSKPDEYGMGVLLAEATRWHDGLAEDGVISEARKLRAALSPASPARTPMGEGRDTAWRDVKDAPQDGTNILLKHRVHGVIEGWFLKGEWTDDTPISPREYTGDMWILGDDLSQDEVEFGPDGEILAGSVEGWLPLAALAAPTPMGGGVEALREALEPFSEGARMAAISGRPPFEFCDAVDYERAAEALAAPTPMGGEVEALREAENEICPHGDNVPADLEPGDTWVCPKCDAEWHTDDSQALAASSPSSAQGGSDV